MRPRWPSSSECSQNSSFPLQISTLSPSPTVLIIVEGNHYRDGSQFEKGSLQTGFNVGDALRIRRAIGHSYPPTGCKMLSQIITLLLLVYFLSIFIEQQKQGARAGRWRPHLHNFRGIFQCFIFSRSWKVLPSLTHLFSFFFLACSLTKQHTLNVSAQ